MSLESKQPLISILMPVYNAAQYLTESLESIVNQSYRNLEIVIVDDGSTDQSLDIVNSFCDSRIAIIRNSENLGLAKSLNIAIQCSSGELLARMDSDDIAHRDRIARQAEFMDNHPEVDVLGSAMQYIGESEYLNYFPQNHAACKSYLIFNVCFGHPSVIFRRHVFNDQANFYEAAYKQYSEEYDLWCRLVDQYQFYNLNDILMYYRTYPSEIKSGAEEQRKKNSAVIRRQYLDKHLGQLSDPDWEVHKIACFLEQCSSVEDLFRIDKWFKKILHLNKATRSFDEGKLQLQLAHRYFEVCYAHTMFGLETMRIYFNSEWRNLYQPPKKTITKYFIKQIIKV